MPPTETDIRNQQITEAALYYERIGARLREALYLIQAAPAEGNGAGVWTVTQTTILPEEPVAPKPRRRGRPRKAKAGPKPARLPMGKKARKPRVKVTPELLEAIKAEAKHGLTHKEIAAKLDLSVGTVAARLRKG